MRRGILSVPARLIVAAALALGGSLTFAAHPVLALSAPTSFGFSSSPGDFVGQGLNEGFDTTNATITASGNAGSVSMTVFTATENWQVRFMPPIGQQLLPGTYVNALRATSNGSFPGLSVAGDGRGCDNDYGSFTLYQLSFGSDGSLTQLDADFVQTRESPTAPPMTGIVRYQASPRSGVALSPSVALSYPGEPVTLTGTALPLGAGIPTGTMTFYDGSTSIGTALLDATGRGSITTVFSIIGSHLLTAVYSGDASHIGGPSAMQTVIVEGGGSTTTWYSYTSVPGELHRGGRDRQLRAGRGQLHAEWQRQLRELLGAHRS